MSMFRDPAERAALIARVAQEGRVSNYDIRLVRADGSEFDGLISGSRIEVDGEPCILWTWSDVTDQKDAQRALRESEARFRALTELSADWYWEQDENFRFVWQRSEDTHPRDGRPPNQIGMTRWEAHADSLSAAEWSAHRAQLEAHESFRNLEFPTRGADGVMRWVSVSGYPIFDDKGIFRGYRGVGRDITERKRNESLLMNIARGVSSELGEAFFRSLVEHLARELDADFAFISELSADRTRTRTLALRAYGQIVPNTEYDTKGSIAELALRGTVVHSSGMPRLLPNHDRIRQHEIEAFVGTPLCDADGTVLGVLAVAHRKPIERGAFWASMIEIFGARAAAEIQRSRAEAQVRGMNESLETIVRERTAQLEDANRELESYNFSISHDLRQPLSAIAGFADLLRDQVAEGDDAVRDSVAEIESNALRMEQMIESLLRLSRAGRGALRKESVESKDLVEAVVHDLSTASPVEAELVVGELPSAQADPALLRQVWTNLIGNALKYSRTNAAARVEISGVRRNGVVEYAVRDNGVGFDMKHAERLFGAFQRLPTSKGFEGTGVGLAIVERIVRRHGGTIRAESTPGRGATFRFTLPQ
jgi:signal transduction histidine kinase/PAS domain-containing protein